MQYILFHFYSELKAFELWLENGPSNKCALHAIETFFVNTDTDNGGKNNNDRGGVYQKVQIFK